MGGPVPVHMSPFTGLLEFPHAPSKMNNPRELAKTAITFYDSLSSQSHKPSLIRCRKKLPGDQDH